MKSNASLLILSASALWGCIGIFQKLLAAAGFSSLQQVAVRSLFSAVLYGLFLFFTDRKALKIAPKHWYYFFGSGICSLLFFNWCYFNAISSSSMAVAAVLLYTAPVFVTFLSALLFRERVTRIKLLSLFITFLGCILVTGLFPSGGQAASPATILFGLGSGIGYALYSIFGKFSLRHYSSQTVTFYTFLFAALGSFPLSGLHQKLSLLTGRSALIGALGISILCCILPYLLYTEGLRHVEAGKAAIIATAEPFVAALLGVLIYRESITLPKLLGMIAILGAIILLNSSKPNTSA